MDKNKFDKVVDEYFREPEDHVALHEAFSWLAKKIWAESTYCPRHKDDTDQDVMAEAVLVCFERRKKWGWNQRGKTACEFFAYIINTVYRHHCSWKKGGTKNGFKVKTQKKVPKAPKFDKPAEEKPAEGKRWGSVKRSGWKPKTGLGE